MKRDVSIENFLKSHGMDGFCGKNVPVIFKRDLAINTFSTIEAGTLGFIQNTDGDILYQGISETFLFDLKLCFPTSSNTMQMDSYELRCEADPHAHTLKVANNRQFTPLSDLIDLADKDTAALVTNYMDTVNAYHSVQENRQRLLVNSFSYGAVTALAFFVLSIIFIPLFKISLVPAIVYSGEIAVVLLLAAGIVSYFCCKHKLTKQSIALREAIRCLHENLIHKDKTFVERYHNK